MTISLFIREILSPPSLKDTLAIGSRLKVLSRLIRGKQSAACEHQRGGGDIHDGDRNHVVRVLRQIEEQMH